MHIAFAAQKAIGNPVNLDQSDCQVERKQIQEENQLKHLSSVLSELLLQHQLVTFGYYNIAPKCITKYVNAP